MQVALPDWAEVYVFGSALRSKTPADLDLLIVYRSELCPHHLARDRANALASTLCKGFGIPLHVVVLSVPEERSVAFIQREGCVPLTAWNSPLG